MNLDIIALALDVALGLVLDDLVLGLVSDLVLNRVLVYGQVVRVRVRVRIRVRVKVLGLRGERLGKVRSRLHMK